MKVHEKAKLYDELMKDFELFLKEVKDHHQSIEEIKTRFESDNKSDLGYYPRLVGTYQGSNFGLSMKISKFEGMLNWYRQLK